MDLALTLSIYFFTLSTPPTMGQECRLDLSREEAFQRGGPE